MSVSSAYSRGRKRSRSRKKRKRSRKRSFRSASRSKRRRRKHSSRRPSKSSSRRHASRSRTKADLPGQGKMLAKPIPPTHPQMPMIGMVSAPQNSAGKCGDGFPGAQYGGQQAGGNFSGSGLYLFYFSDFLAMCLIF